MGRPSHGTLRALEMDLARETARREHAEHVAERLMALLADCVRGGVPPAMTAALAPAEPPAAPDPRLAEVTERVRAECDRWADTPRQRALNLNYCYDLARKGTKEAEIIAKLRRGEIVEVGG
jgi:cell pole-organizing protein PopZ